MKASRLLSILMLLQARTKVSAPALAEALEVSERTILRDIDQLSAAGVPVWGERGRNGGFQLRPGWSTQLTGLTEPEVGGLFLAGLPKQAAELGLGAAAASARLKVIAGLPGEWRARAEQIAACLHIDPLDWYRTDEKPAFLREVADAVWASRGLRIRYDSWNGVRERDVDPLGLVLKAGVWYFVAQSPTRRSVATYRLGNVLDAWPGTRGFKRPRGFDLARHWAASIERFEAELQTSTADVRASPRALRWFANARMRITVLQPPTAGDDRTRVLLPIESIEHGARQLLGYGAEIEVIAPQALRDAVGEAARAVAAMYAEGAS